jgi:hypothetical protein
MGGDGAFGWTWTTMMTLASTGGTPEQSTRSPQDGTYPHLRYEKKKQTTLSLLFIFSYCLSNYLINLISY